MAINVVPNTLKANLRIFGKARSIYLPSTWVCSREKNFVYPATCHVVPHRTVTTNNPGTFFRNLMDGYSIRSALKKVGILNVKKSVLRRNGYLIYEKVSDNFDYRTFFEKFNLPDTFNSWFLVMELHIWMILVRLMAEAEEGRYIRNSIIEAMWEDIREKSGLLGAEHVHNARKQIKYLSEEFQAALLGYDEGLLSDDVTLAGAVWRRFFSRECDDPELVEDLVAYIRKQVKYFDDVTREDIVSGKPFKWININKIGKNKSDGQL